MAQNYFKYYTLRLFNFLITNLKIKDDLQFFVKTKIFTPKSRFCHTSDLKKKS